MGIIIIDEIMVIYLIFSVLRITKLNLVGCQLIGLIGVFSTFSGAAYNFYLSQLILSVSKVFNPKDLSHLKFHFYSLIIGLLCSLFSISIQDIGITCFGNCGVARGSILEFLSITIIVFIWPYCIYSAIKCWICISKDNAFVNDQKILYISHVYNIAIFTITTMPMLFLFFFDYSLKMNPRSLHNVRGFVLSLVALTPTLHVLCRIFCDKQLKDKILCKRVKNNSFIDSIIQDENIPSQDQSIKKVRKASERPIYEKITQAETLNNLLSTFSGICLLINEIYNLYEENQFTKDIIDSLSFNYLVSKEVLKKKLTKTYTLESLHQKFNQDKNLNFPPELEKNFQKELKFEITEYGCLIFQNLRNLEKIKKDILINSLLPFNNTKTLIKSFEKTSAKGGKPLIKTHDKRLLIKEVKKDEKDFFIKLLPKYHLHLKKNRRSLLAKIIGVYSIRIGDKDKVYQVLMESLDPVDEQYIKFKYDLKFSTVNRREFKRTQEVKVVQEELISQDPSIEELFPRNELRTLQELEKRLRNKTNSNMTESKDDFQNKESNGSGSQMTKRSGNSQEDRSKSSEQGISQRKNSSCVLSDDQDQTDDKLFDDDENFENEDFFLQLDYEEQLVYREQRNLYNQQKQWSQTKKTPNYQNTHVKKRLLQKLGLLKDSDFKCMHDRKLPVEASSEQTIFDFTNAIESDVRFLESLRIMDYSLFLIIIRVPEDLDFADKVDQCQESIDKKQKQEQLQEMIQELCVSNRFVLYSPSRKYIYLMGLIDYLGKWNLNKKLEMYSKTFLAHFIRQNTDFSVKPPHEFANRFIKKVKRVFYIVNNNNQEEQNENFINQLQLQHNQFYAEFQKQNNCIKECENKVSFDNNNEELKQDELSEEQTNEVGEILNDYQ